MPAPTTLKKQGQACLNAAKLKYFSARPAAILGGQAVTLSWDVDTSHCLPVGLFTLSLGLNKVATSGSMTLRPAKTIVYELLAQAGPASEVMSRITVDVDDSACQPLTLPASGITPGVVAGVKTAIDNYNADPANSHKVIIKKNESSIGVGGVLLNIQLDLDINDFPDPTISIVANVMFQILPDGSVFPYYNTFSVAVDWPWWVKIIGNVVTAVVEHFIGDEVSGSIKTEVLNGLASTLDGIIASSGTVVTAIDTIENFLVVTLCPAPKS